MSATADHDPAAILAQARSLLERGASGSWPRVVSHLTRQMLEGLLDAMWLRRAPGVENASMRAQLVCLESYLGDSALAGRIAFAWTELSKACHLHAYDLAPTGAELGRWIDEVEALAGRLGSSTGTLRN